MSTKSGHSPFFYTGILLSDRLLVISTSKYDNDKVKKPDLNG